ncbi:hypothetical protein TUM17378_19700 [Shewanella algae]|nr:hypothetical protein TUM17378_19700 [Shewanella algae]
MALIVAEIMVMAETMTVAGTITKAATGANDLRPVSLWRQNNQMRACVSCRYTQGLSKQA